MTVTTYDVQRQRYVQEYRDPAKGLCNEKDLTILELKERIKTLKEQIAKLERKI